MFIPNPTRPNCPACQSSQVVRLYTGKKIGTIAGGIAGTASGVAGTLSSLTGVITGAEIGMAVGIVAGPAGRVLAGFAGAVIGGLVGYVSGCIAGAKIGDALDQHVLDNHLCLSCKHSFFTSVPATDTDNNTFEQ